jgi:peptide/nickel transport system substrate-binding protein
MEIRFGLKDFVVFFLIFALGAGVLLLLVQGERRWEETRALRQSVEQQTKLLADIERALNAERASASAPAAESWARPNVPITTPRPWDFQSDPRSQPNFATGGTLTELFEGKTRTLTPYLANDPYSFRIVHESVCESLAALDPVSFELRGVLAEAWQEDPAGRWLRVKIRNDAAFSDGGPVTAEDVRFTFADYIMNQEFNAGAYRSEAGQIEKIEAVSNKVVEFTFKEPRYTNLRAALRNSILPAHFYKGFTPEQLNASTSLLMGSGPYRLESLDPENQWKPDSEVVLARNERYWGPPERTPPIGRLRFVFVPDNGARLVELEEGRGDMMRSTPEQHAAKSKDPSFNEEYRALAWTNMRSGFAIIAWNCGPRNGKPTPFADARVRRAMTQAFDRERINRDFFEGLCEVATGPFPKWQADPAIKPWPFDIEASRRLLADAGWADRDGDGAIENERGEALTWELTSARGSIVGERVSPYLIDQCKKLGVAVTTRVVDAATLGQLRQSLDYDAMPTQWSWSDPTFDPFQTLHSSQIGGGDNWIQYQNPEVDALIEQARRTIEPAARAELWHQVHRILHEDQPSLYLLNVPWMRFISKRIENVHTYPAGLDRREWFIPASKQ